MVDALDILEKFVMEAGRPCIMGLPGIKIERRTGKDLASYFTRLATQLKPDRLAKLVKTASTKESGYIAAQHLAKITVRKMQPQLMAVLKAGYLEAFHVARKHEHVQEADQPFNRKDTNLLADAVEWAEKQAGELVQGIDQFTVDSIADAVASGIEDQLGVEGTAREIRDVLEGWATSRAFTIATTEINRAMSAATVDMFDGGYKRWILAPEACPICEANAEQGAIPVDDDFDSGDSYPPAHPNCRCAITAARPPEAE
jgi:hypothetical protein